MKKTTLYLTRGAIIAALYVALTFVSASLGLHNGVIQFRISEMLCILPVFFPEAVAGLTLGCFLANLLSACAMWDVIFGSIATLIGAFGAYLLRRLPRKIMWLATLPTVISNVLIVPPVLILVYEVKEALPFLMLTVGIGEIVCAGICGSLLYYSMRKNKFLMT
jgi:uncharacterized membrane protein